MFGLAQSHWRLLRKCALAGTVLVLGCLPLPGGHSLSRRTIAAKAADALVATDGAVCRAAPATIDSATVGTDHLCVWKEPEGETGFTRQRGALGGKSPRRAVPPDAKPPKLH